jgi:hypothetical protein
MPTEIVPFAAEHLDRVARFSEQVWRRPRSDAYLRWRYLAHPHHHAYLALHDGQCVAMLSAFRRPYRVGERLVTVSDSFDWFCLPELRRAGFGVRVMQRMMQDPHPVIVTGGTPDTRDLLPRMGFSVPAQVSRFALPLDGRRAADAIARRTGLPRAAVRVAFGLARPWFAPRRRSAPRGGRAEATATLGEEALAIDPRPGGQGTAPHWTAAYAHWLAAAFPGFGHYLPLYFARGDALVGWTLLRIYTGENGCEAALLDVRACEPDPELYTWLISEAALRAEGLGAGLLLAATSCAHVETAFRRNRFRMLRSDPIHFYSKAGVGLDEPIVFGSHWGDETLVPYPTTEWDVRRPPQATHAGGTSS